MNTSQKIKSSDSFNQFLSSFQSFVQESVELELKESEKNVNLYINDELRNSIQLIKEQEDNELFQPKLRKTNQLKKMTSMQNIIQAVNTTEDPEDGYNIDSEAENTSTHSDCDDSDDDGYHLDLHEGVSFQTSENRGENNYNNDDNDDDDSSSDDGESGIIINYEEDEEVKGRSKSGSFLSSVTQRPQRPTLVTMGNNRSVRLPATSSLSDPQPLLPPSPSSPSPSTSKPVSRTYSYPSSKNKKRDSNNSNSDSESDSDEGGDLQITYDVDDDLRKSSGIRISGKIENNEGDDDGDHAYDVDDASTSPYPSPSKSKTPKKKIIDSGSDSDSDSDDEKGITISYDVDLQGSNDNNNNNNKGEGKEEIIILSSKRKKKKKKSKKARKVKGIIFIDGDDTDHPSHPPSSLPNADHDEHGYEEEDDKQQQQGEGEGEVIIIGAKKHKKRKDKTNNRKGTSNKSSSSSKAKKSVIFSDGPPSSSSSSSSINSSKEIIKSAQEIEEMKNLRLSMKEVLNISANMNINHFEDWNEMFQESLRLKEKGYARLAHLARDFFSSSKTYGKIIISEFYLPENEKTIKSINAGGIAGGSKYIVSGIFFKFCLDTCISKARSLWMYGGNEPDDFAAMKAGSNEMLGLLAYYNTKVDGLYYPLMNLIEFRGFRVLAMSILPISNTTICYGSRDGGKTVHKSISSFNKKMKEAATRLNLRGHRVIPHGLNVSFSPLPHT